MPKPQRLDLTVDDVLKEIESWPAAQAKPRMIDQLNENDRKVLCVLMRSGKKMHQICEYWTAAGKPGGSANTMRTMFRALQEMGY